MQRSTTRIRGLAIAIVAAGAAALGSAGCTPTTGGGSPTTTVPATVLAWAQIDVRCQVPGTSLFEPPVSVERSTDNQSWATLTAGVFPDPPGYWRHSVLMHLPADYFVPGTTAASGTVLLGVRCPGEPWTTVPNHVVTRYVTLNADRTEFVTQVSVAR